MRMRHVRYCASVSILAPFVLSAIVAATMYASSEQFVIKQSAVEINDEKKLDNMISHVT